MTSEEQTEWKMTPGEIEELNRIQEKRVGIKIAMDALVESAGKLEAEASKCWTKLFLRIGQKRSNYFQADTTTGLITKVKK